MKEVGLLRRQLADEVEEREELQAKQGGVNDLFEKYKTEQEAIQAEAERKEALRRNLAVSGAGDEKDGKDGGKDGKGGGKDGKGGNKPGANDAGSSLASRTQNMITFRQQRAQEIKNLQALSRVGSSLGPLSGTGRFQAEPESRYIDPRAAGGGGPNGMGGGGAVFGGGFSPARSRNAVQFQVTDTAPRGPTITDPLQLALWDALNTQRTLNNLRTSGQMRSLQTGTEL